MARVTSSKKRPTINQVITLIILLILIVIMTRMVLIVFERSKLATQRRDAARAELEEVETLATKLESEAIWLQSESGKSKALRDRYGIISENEGYLILLHNHTEEPESTDEKWWQKNF